jgi:hypothetical protein
MLKSALAGDDIDTAGLVDEIENLRQGTRSQYESPWTIIQGTTSMPANGQIITFTHGLEEIPWMVDVMSSKESDGRKPIEGANLTITKNETTLTVQNGNAADLYFKVRAM